MEGRSLPGPFGHSPGDGPPATALAIGTSAGAKSHSSSSPFGTHAWASYIGARKNGDPPASHDWRWYSGVVDVPAGTKTLRISCQIYGPGKVWFDDLLARFDMVQLAEQRTVGFSTGQRKRVALGSSRKRTDFLTRGQERPLGAHAT